MTDYATLLRDHVTLKVRSIDRIFHLRPQPADRRAGMPLPPLAAKLQDSLLCGLWPNRRAIYQGHRSLCRTTEHSPGAVQEGTRQRGTGSPLLQAAARAGQDRVVLIGTAQQRASVWRSWPRKGPEKAVHPHMDWGRQMAYPNHFYFYLWDAQWGATFCKTNAYAPFPIWLWLNGHAWAKRQLEKAGIRYEALDNGFRSCAAPRPPAEDLR
jgi:hypothetical protein